MRWDILCLQESQLGCQCRIGLATIVDLVVCIARVLRGNQTKGQLIVVGRLVDVMAYIVRIAEDLKAGRPVPPGGPPIYS